MSTFDAPPGELNALIISSILNLFGLAVPTLCPDVPADVLDPRRTWLNPQAYDAQARRLADLFAANIRKFGDVVPDDVRKAGPRVR